MTAASTLAPLPLTRYTHVAIAFHWVLAIAIVTAFSVGIYMTDLPFSPTRLKLFNWHKWAGVTILALSALRLLWRLRHRPPADLPMPAWQRWGAHAMHWLLYGFFFLVPLSGWAYSSAEGFQIVWFGVLPLPDLVAADPAVAETLKNLHHNLAFALGLLVLLHIAAALKHQFLDRDNLIGRMWPARAAPRLAPVPAPAPVTTPVPTPAPLVNDTHPTP